MVSPRYLAVASASIALDSLKKDRLSIVKGIELISCFVKYPGSLVGFCSQCGPCLLNEKLDWETTNIRLGLLDDPTLVEPSFL